MARLFMEEIEILNSFRTALDRRAQIRVLAELNATDSRVILDVLERRGEDVAIYRRLGDRRRLTPEEDEARYALYDQGLSDAKIAMRLGRTEECISDWRRCRGLYANGR